MSRASARGRGVWRFTISPMPATSDVGTAIAVAAITSASIGSVAVALLTGRLERRRHLREQMLDAATTYATQALTVLATLREVKMATLEQRHESTAHRNAHLLTDHAECRRRLDACEAAQALMRAQHARVRLLFGPDSTATRRNDEFTRATHRMLNAARRFYELAREPTADLD